MQDSGLPARTLAITPADPMLQVSGKAATLQLGVTLDGRPLAAAQWSSDNLLLGSIDDKGVFHSKGLVAGTATVTANYGGYQATAVIHVTTQLEQVTSGVTQQQHDSLKNGTPTADPALSWLYPYDGTVFPRGLPGPFMQFGGGAADALRLTLDVGDFHYDGYFPASSPAGITLPANVWDALTQSSDGKQAVSVSVTKLVGTTLSGPATQKWRIAPGSLKGVVYYNTYSNGGAVMRIRPGKDAETMLTGCTVCHAVSAQGNVLAAGVNWSAKDENNVMNPVDSKSFDLLADGGAPVRDSNTDGRRFSFAALTPDGSKFISNGVLENSPIRGITGPAPSKLYDSKTGAEISAPTFTDQVEYAVSPVFAPDGSRLSFSAFDNNVTGKQLQVMDVNFSKKPPVFGAPGTVVTVEQGIVGWPSFFPDAKGIVYQEGDHFDTGTYGGGKSFAELRLVDTGKGNAVNPILKLNGWKAQDKSYLPYGADEENHRDYEPSVLPVPVGGYYWVIFTSRRAYGHTLAPGGTVPGTDNEWGTFANNVETPSLRKKLWIAAIDINYSGKTDPSHPAFYLPGQDLNAGNMRAYTSLEPCRKDGDTCESGADCCGGFCRRVDASSEFSKVTYTCVPPPVGCSNVDESCELDADCCGAASGNTCINHRCAAPNVVIE